MHSSPNDVPVDDRAFGILRRMGSRRGIDAFLDQAKGARFCSRPVRLKGKIEGPDAGGNRSVLFDTSALPDGVLLKACGTRRETLCKPCASIYRGDALALVAAGLRGGKGVPETVSEHPALLVTLTAPSFGLVHRRQANGTCHPDGRRCVHGRALYCRTDHPDGDAALGQALCPDCYDYRSAVLFNLSISELWRRTAIYALRALGNLAGLSVRETVKTIRLSYVKVVEFQKRGSAHVHAVVRLDSAGESAAPPPDMFTSDLLATAIRIAASRVSCRVPKVSPDVSFRAKWGNELDVQVIVGRGDSRHKAAYYLAKYSTKSTNSAGVLDHRLRAGFPLTIRLSNHLRLLVEEAWKLGVDPQFGETRLRLWAHTAGYRGHFLTKSRRYSTTFARLRAERHEWTLARKQGEADGVQSLLEPLGTKRTWRFVGIGYLNAGELWLVESKAQSHREELACAYEDRRQAA
jgi:hypothetical protein